MISQRRVLGDACWLYGSVLSVDLMSLWAFVCFVLL